MRKWLLVFGVILAMVLLGMVVYSVQQRAEDKSLSPEARAIFEEEDWEMGVTYSQPSKRGRKVFGALVPFQKLWRTGANEATVFYTDVPILIKDQLVLPGRYHLLTIPEPDKWTIILNSDIPGWGIEKSTGKTYYNPNTDVLRTVAEVTPTVQDAESFVINFEKEKDQVVLVMQWENTRVTLPIQRAIQ